MKYLNGMPYNEKEIELVNKLVELTLKPANPRFQSKPTAPAPVAAPEKKFRWPWQRKT